MKIGIIPNTSKSNIILSVTKIIAELKKHNLDFILPNALEEFKAEIGSISSENFMPAKEIGTMSDMIISIGGDGTMLHTAYELRNSNVPLMGVNIGKLGFLTEYDLKDVSEFVKDLVSGNYFVEERITLEGNCLNCVSPKEKLFALNDIVIDKGPWPKMIEIKIEIDNQHVSTFSADGMIIATPTGSTGYSLSTGGPIVSPQAKVLTLSPIAPHTLTMRPLVISADQEIKVTVNSPSDKIQVSCDGQRVEYFKPLSEIIIRKSTHAVKLVHSSKSSYYQILRNKLFWGLDLRKRDSL